MFGLTHRHFRVNATLENQAQEPVNVIVQKQNDNIITVYLSRLNHQGKLESASIGIVLANDKVDVDVVREMALNITVWRDSDNIHMGLLPIIIPGKDQEPPTE